MYMHSLKMVSNAHKSMKYTLSSFRGKKASFAYQIMLTLPNDKHFGR